MARAYNTSIGLDLVPMPRRPAQPKTPAPPDGGDPLAGVKPARRPSTKAANAATVGAAQPALPLTTATAPKRRPPAKLAPAGALPPARIPKESLEAPRGN